jgi:putative flippase GtrA
LAVRPTSTAAAGEPETTASPRRPLPGELARSAIVGVVATLADLLALAILVDVLGVAAQAANVPALLVGVVVQFVGNKLVTFRDGSPAWLEQAARFAAVEAGAFALNALAFAALALVVPYWAARLCGSALVYFLYSYPLWRRVFA